MLLKLDISIDVEKSVFAIPHPCHLGLSALIARDLNHEFGVCMINTQLFPWGGGVEQNRSETLTLCK